MRSAAIPLLCAALLAGCDQEAPKGWFKADGSQPTSAELEIERTICHGEVQKALLTSSNRGFSITRENAMQDAYTGCMAQRGLMLKEIR